jgi:arylsulfatase B
MHKFNAFVFSLLFCLSVSLIGQEPTSAVESVGGKSKKADQPNVVIVITDDQGYGDLSCHGNPVLKTPRLDELYAESVRLTDYHVAPTCSPSRAALMTGHWTNRTGVWHTIMGRSMLRENEITIGQVFKDAGYATGMFGKWHLGDNYPYRPDDRGFTEVLRHGGGGVGQTPDYWDNAYFDGSYWHNGTPTPVEGFCTDVFFDYAKKFIKSQKESGQPFLAYISTNAPHGPMHCPEEYSAPYADTGVGTANFLGMIANIDDNVGQLREMLAEEGLAENTIFIFTTDNGTSSGAKIFNAGMRGKKGSEYDGGHRVPFFVHWPAGEIQGGKDIDMLTAHVDVLPTLIEWCSVDRTDIDFDGKNIATLFNDDRDQAYFEIADRMLITDSQRVKDPIKWRKSSVMTNKWRLINGKELYNLAEDPGQKNNVFDEHVELRTKMIRFYEDWWTELEPTFANETPIYIGHPAENPARLTSHDWITVGGAPWNQAHIRKASNGPKETGFWNINVHQAGKYEIALRRWPREADLAIDSGLAPGADVPGVKAMRTQQGKAITPVKTTLQIGDIELECDFVAGEKKVVFTVELAQGRTQMAGRFVEADGTEYGTYFAYVKKLE